VLNSQLDRLWSMLTEHNGQLADVWIYSAEYPGARPTALPAHKCILAAACPALIRKINPRRTSSCTTADSASGEIDGAKKRENSEETVGVRRLDLTEVAPTWAVMSLLRYIYGQTVEVESGRLSVLYTLAKDMQCRGLENDCLEKMENLRKKTVDCEEVGKLGARKDTPEVGERQRSPKSDSGGDVEPVVAESSVDAAASTSSSDRSEGVSKVEACSGNHAVKTEPTHSESSQFRGAVTDESGLKKSANSSSTGSFLDMIRNSGSLPKLDRGRMINTPGAFDKKYELVSPEEGGILGEGMNGAVRLAKDRFTGEQ
ncbi:hypothetical protein FOZ63_026243, partial [Perkinsus olseni]